jgi:hypothetical protein
MIKHDMKFINIIYPQGIQDHKAITNKVASLPWFIHKHDTGEKHATSIQVSTRREGKLTIHAYKGFQEPSKAAWRIILSWSPHKPKIKYHRAHVLQPRLHTYTQGDKEDRALDPKGLERTYLGIQYLVTWLRDALNLSSGLAWCKCQFKWKGFPALSESCLKGPTRDENIVLP